ncbi:MULTISPECIES: hypothetical protein [Acidobacterium]|uniref:hypothetical protein n=1 Tax=Acidobacterium TaxID=33973 RepID=UPI000305054B|nr:MULTISPECIES: hypothetical protein [Acidobacterium]HCT59549.1 hypothetical protein [Acidobacterium sp.]
MKDQALFLELLVSGFFAVACFKARAGEIRDIAQRPRDLFRLTDRVERLSRSRWQWFAMVGILILVRLQTGVPLVVELTAALQFIVFLALPVAKEQKSATRERVTLETPVRKGRSGRHRRVAVPVSGPGAS